MNDFFEKSESSSQEKNEVERNPQTENSSQENSQEQSAAQKSENENMAQDYASPPPPATPSEKITHTLRANSLYKSFGKKQVVKGVDFFVNTGEVL